jgi:DNA-binding PadR family transcriptional regulator
MFTTMPTPKTPPPSGLGLIVLWQLNAQSMHVYRMQKLFEQEGKDRVVNVRSRASLYQAIERLVRLGLVQAAGSEHHPGYPDRVIYAITDAGRDVAHDWLRQLLRDSGEQYPDFIAALSVVFGLEPDDAQTQLEHRAERLAAELASCEAAVAQAPPGLPRLFLLEEEYRGAVLRAELEWVRGVIADLRDGRLTWSEEWLRELATTFLAADEEHDNRSDA